MSAGTLRGAGSGAVGRGVLTALAKLRADVALEAWVPRDWPSIPLGNVPVHNVRAGHATKMWIENATLRARLAKGDFDALFSLGDTGTPYAPGPHLLLIHQPHLAYSRDEWGFRPSPSFSRKMVAIDAYFRLGLRSITRFTVQTEDMRAHLSARWEIDPSIIEVVPSSIFPLPSYTPVHAARPYIACVTSSAEHKNLDVLPDVVAGMRNRDTTLWITVRPGDAPRVVSRAVQLGISSRLVFTGPVDRSTAFGLLAGAAAAVLPGRLESFGLGYYEALAVGCPVVAADRGFAREACGDAALYASPDDPDAFAGAIDSLLESPSLRKELIRRGSGRVPALLTWDDVAARYVTSLRRAIGTDPAQ